MSRIQTNIRIISSDGGNFAYFTDKKDLYSKLSGVKDNLGENIEFIEIGKNIQLNEKTLKILDVNLKFENISSEIKHIEKTEITAPENLIIEIIITVENVPFEV